MDVKQIEERLSTYLSQPCTTYQLCADTGVGFSTMLTYLKILEAAGKTSRVRSAKKTLWMLTNKDHRSILPEVKGRVVAPAQPVFIEREEDK